MGDLTRLSDTSAYLERGTEWFEKNCFSSVFSHTLFKKLYRRFLRVSGLSRQTLVKFNIMNGVFSDMKIFIFN